MRAQVVLLQDARILMARHELADHSYWILPGGSVEDGETPEEAAVREVGEESGLDIEVIQLLFIDEPRAVGDILIRNPRYTYLGRIVGGRLLAIEDEPCAGRAWRFTGCAWMPFHSDECDAATLDTLRLVQTALQSEASIGGRGSPSQ